MKLEIIKGVLVICVCLSILLILYSMRSESFFNVEVAYKFIKVVTDESNITTVTSREQPSILPRLYNCSYHKETEDVKAVSDAWNVFDAHSSKNYTTYTIIVQTYKRDDLLKRFLRHYNRSSFPHLDQILVIWNNIGMPVYTSAFYQKSSHEVPVKFVLPKVNTMRNRCQPFPQIRTTAVMIVDDDLLIEASDVEFAFHVWQQFPQRIVGFVSRHHISKPDGTIGYADYSSKSYSLVLIGASFIHKGYLKMFNETLSPQIHYMIDETMNCDDLAMNVMIGDYLEKIGVPQPTGLRIAPLYPIQNMEKQAMSGFHGVSALPDHIEERAYCLKKLNDTYHRLPLLFTNVVISRLK